MMNKKYFAPRRYLSPLALAIQLTFALTAMATYTEASAQAKRYSIPAGPLVGTLNRFAQEAGVSIVMDAGQVGVLRSPGLQGSHEVEEGFKGLLRGTGYTISKTAAGYMLVPVPVLSKPEAKASVTSKAESREENVLQEVTVSASRSNMDAAKAPQTVQIIKKEEIEQQLAISSNSSDVLSNLIPSYTPSRGKMNGSGETMRGRTPLILIDGVPQSNPIRPTGREAHTIDFSMVERIEVIQGANAINGLGATGGTINIITRRPENGSFNQHVDVQATMPTSDVDSDGMSYKTTYRADGRQDKLDYLFAVSYENQGLYRDAEGRSIGADNTQGDLMDSRAYDLLGKIGYWLTDEQRLQLSVNRYRIKSKANYLAVTGNRALGIPTTSIEGQPRGTPPWNDVWTTALTYDHYNIAGMQLSAMFFHQKFEGLFGADNSATFQDATIAPVGALYDQSRASSSKYGSKVSLTKSDLVDGRLKVTTGFDTLIDSGKQDLYGTGRTWVPESEYNNLSLFAQGEFKLLDNLTLHGGVRKEYADLTVDSYRTLAKVNVQGGKLNFDETLYNLGLTFTPVQDLTFFTSYSEGFGMPDVGRVLRSIKTAGQNVDDMNTLAPILTKSVEFGGRFKRGNWDVNASLFQSDSDYGSRVIRVGDAFMLTREKNHIEGFDTSVAYRFNRMHQAKVAYTHTKGRYDSNADGTLDAKLDGLNVAPDRVIISLATDWNDKLSTFVQAQHAFTQSFDDPARHFKGYTLVDASVRYKLPKGTVRLAIGNLLNEDYITYYSQSALVEPLRYFAGRGRTLTIGYSIDF